MFRKILNFLNNLINERNKWLSNTKNMPNDANYLMT